MSQLTPEGSRRVRKRVSVVGYKGSGILGKEALLPPGPRKLAFRSLGSQIDVSTEGPLGVSFAAVEIRRHASGGRLRGALSLRESLVRRGRSTALETNRNAAHSLDLGSMSISDEAGPRSSMFSFFAGDEEVQPLANDFSSTYSIRAAPEDTGERYLDYLSRGAHHRHSSAFIQKLDSLQLLETMEVPPVKVMGPYVLGDKIGEGSFGKVKEGINAETLERVAVKVVKRQRLKHMPDALASTIREIKMIRKLRHRNVVRLLDVFCKVETEKEGTALFDWYEEIEQAPVMLDVPGEIGSPQTIRIQKWYIVQELCSCSVQDLLDLDELQNIPVELAHHFYLQLVEGLDYLHSRHIAHRDIKPPNLLITLNGVLKIADFGVAEEYSLFAAGDLLTGSYGGTYHFMAPETLVVGTRFSAVKADIWASGITLMYMLLGILPEDAAAGPSSLEPLFAQLERIHGFSATALAQGVLNWEPAQRPDALGIKKSSWATSSYPMNESQMRALIRRASTLSAGESVVPLADPSNTTTIITPMTKYLDALFAENFVPTGAKKV
ncbi:kinase-like domain-containing protein [Hyaloraphidium curvatum]|nr:kinase-like domain-containing protein [Hyaloraphidium curvatum]